MPFFLRKEKKMAVTNIVYPYVFEGGEKAVASEVNDNVELSLRYEGQFRDDYTDHTGLLNAKYKF